ncbi:MAG: hypothetical protein ACXIVD_03775 [Salinarimonas sp.]
MKQSERARFLNQLIMPSINEAAAQGMSLALIRPQECVFRYRKKSAFDLEFERERFALAARQQSLFDKELAALEPTPYEFKFDFDDGTPHSFTCADWEVHTTFYKRRNESGSEENALRWMDEKFNDEYPRKGMAFAVGTIAAFPTTWMLLGVIRLDEVVQGELGL